LNEKAAYFGFSHSGSVSGIIGKVKNRMDDLKIKKQFKVLKKTLTYKLASWFFHSRYMSLLDKDFQVIKSI